VVRGESLAEETAVLVDRLVRGPAEGIAATKAALNAEMDMDVFTALDHEARVQAELMTRPDFQEGYKAFVEKRQPRFSGAPE
jgi:enoyl-CoA hydratase/carnithine racemase